MNGFKASILATGVFLLGSSFAVGAAYDIDLSHSEVGFKVRHLVSKTRGRFDKFSGTIDFDAKKLNKLSANVSMETASVNTNDEKRDGHLRNADFFDVEKYPTMTFKSKKAKKAGKNKIALTGDLTLLGVTKPVTLDVEFLGETTDPWGGTRSGFTAKGKLNRKDFGMEYNISDKGGLVIGNEVEILLEIEAIKKK